MHLAALDDQTWDTNNYCGNPRCRSVPTHHKQFIIAGHKYPQSCCKCCTASCFLNPLLYCGLLIHTKCSTFNIRFIGVLRECHWLECWFCNVPSGLGDTRGRLLPSSGHVCDSEKNVYKTTCYVQVSNAN